MEVVVMDVATKPCCLFLYTSLLYFASRIDIMSVDMNTGKRETICTLPLPDKYTNYISSLYVISGRKFLVGVQSFDENYDSTSYNGLYYVDAESLVTIEKILPTIDNEKVYLLTSITKGDSGLFYVTDSYGNVYWVDFLSNRERYGLVMGTGKSMYPNYYYGFESSFVDNIQRYDQTGHGVGLSSCVISNGDIICSNYGLGVVLIASLDDTGKNVISDIDLKLRYTGFYFYSRIRLHDDRLYISSAVRKENRKLVEGNVLYEVLNNKLVAVTEHNDVIKCISDFLVQDNRAIIVSSDRNSSSIISVPLIR